MVKTSPASFIGGRPSEAISERYYRQHSIDRADDDNIRCAIAIRVKDAATLGFREQDFVEDIVHPIDRVSGPVSVLQNLVWLSRLRGGAYCGAFIWIAVSPKPELMTLVCRNDTPSNWPASRKTKFGGRA